MIYFDDSTHSYYSADKEFKWTSVTQLIGLYKEKFDAPAVAAKVSKNPKSKWYGKTPQEIIELWDNEAKRATDLGDWYHKQIENSLLGCSTIERQGTTLSVKPPLFNPEGYKVAPEQKLTDGIYPEHMVYLLSSGICGQSDLVEVINNKVYITDHKTNKEIKTAGFKNWEGIVSKMKTPLNHLDDCHLMHYTIQLSLYMFMILKHNPGLQPGGIALHHITFENTMDDNNFPIATLDPDGNPIVDKVNIYQLEYMKKEVFDLLKHFAANKEKLLKK